MVTSSKGIYSVLIVDDDPVICALLKTVVNQLGHLAETCLDARTALKSLSDRKDALLILDYQLPDWSGVDVIRELRRSGNNIPVMLISSLSPEEVIPRYLGLEFVEFHAKPVDLSILRESISRLVGTSKT